MSTRLLAAAFALVLTLPGVSTATVYDAASAFSPTANPNGVWSYGFSATLGSLLELDPERATDNGIDVWRTNIWLGDPAVFHNGTGHTITNSTGTLVMPAGALALHPGPSGQYSLLRFTALADGVYQVAAAFSGLDIVGTTTDVHILSHGAALFDGQVNGYGPGPTYSTAVTLKAGETIDFAVGWGANHEFSYDSTGLSAQITSQTTTTPDCQPPPAGLVGWWRAEGNALDSAGTNTGALGGNATYGPGFVGQQAFAFDGTNSYVTVSPAASLDVGAGPGLTIEGWLKPQGDIGNNWACLAEWNDGAGHPGAHLWLSQPDYYPYLGGGPGCLFVNLVDTGFNYHLLSSPAYTMDTNGWQHVAVTYDKASGQAVIYRNGAVVASANLGTFEPQTSYGLNFGKRLSFGDIFGPYRGEIDEMSLYDRALSAAEIQALYAAAGAGKCVSNTPPACVTPPTGLVSWWPAEGDALDAVGVNNPSTLNGTSFATGKVGSCFNLDGLNNYLHIAASPSITVGLSNGFTVEGWINPTETTSSMVIVEYERALGTYSPSDVGLDFSINSHGLGTIDGNIKESNQANHEFCSSPGVITAGVWQHVAVTYDRGSGMAHFYVNGSSVVATNIGSFTPLTSFSNVLIGARTTFSSPSTPNTVFAGGIDELSIYNRALTADEIRALYSAQGAGKCSSSVAPTITSQPVSQVASVGASVSFTVGASGAQPLNYQWRFNGADLDGQTSSSLTLANVQLTDAGTYSVVVSNLVGAVTSSDAVLTVNGAAGCLQPPAGLVAWWRAEGNLFDSIGGNDGIVAGNPQFGVGKVGQCLVFSGEGDAVDVGFPDNFSVQTFTIEGWVRRASTSVVSFQGDGSGYFLSLGEVNCMGFALDAGGQPILDKHWVGHVGAGVSVTDTNWHHVAVTKDQSTVVFYIDGKAYPAPAFDPGFWAGSPVAVGGWFYEGAVQNSFYGAIDELSYYNRALSAAEIEDLYAAEDGKCFTPFAPTITKQPADQVTSAGATVAFSVGALGTQPRSYQWRFNGSNLAGQTSSQLTLAGVQLANAGTYSVVVSNLLGAVTSSNAVLTVKAQADCIQAPAGLVDWWRAEGNALDSAGTHNGTLNGTTFAPGEVGQGFAFDGSSAAVDLGNWFNLQVFSVALWVKPGDSQMTYADIIDNNHSDTPYRSWTVQYQNTRSRFDWGIYSVNSGFVHLPFDLKSNIWQHLVLTLDPNHTARVYVDGQLQGATNLIGDVSYDGTEFLRLGRWGGGGRYFNGLLDEVDIYNRALAPTEIQALYASGSAGKCFAAAAPVITTQPVSQFANAGTSVSFNVAASGTAPLSYQWLFNSSPLPGKTATTLNLANVQLTDIGTYSVVVSNLAGAVTSSNALLTVNMPVCVAPPAGLVGWWRGEGDTADMVGPNNGLAQGSLSYAGGEVGRAFSFDGRSSYLTVPASASLNVGTNAGFTLECWIEPVGDLSTDWAPLFEWNNGQGRTGGQCWLSQPISGYFGNGPGCLFLNLIDTAGTYHMLCTPAHLVTTNGFQHVAVTYEKGSGIATIYYNGAVAASKALGSFTVQTSYPLIWGKRVSNTPQVVYRGLMDEMSVYARALSPAEVQALYAAGTAGKCFTPVAPTITTPPASLVTSVGLNAAFTVAASGTAPLSYQWLFNGVPLAGQTTTALSLSNVQLTNAGTYSVVVSNMAGTASAEALLTVDLPLCEAPPAGIVGWWRAESNALDSVSGKLGTLVGNAHYDAGRVGRAFVFDGNADGVNVGPGANLWLENFSVEAWIKRTSTTVLSYNGNGNATLFAVGTTGGPTFYLDASGHPTLGKMQINWVSANTTITDLNWHHVAVTKNQTNVVFYVDGTAYSAPAYNPGFVFASPAVIGAWVYGSTYQNTFYGSIDELAVYNRALSAAEIQGLYFSSTTGKCTAPPSIVTQPVSASPIEGSNVTLSVTAAGNPVLHYQWLFNGTNLAGATGTSLTLTNVQWAVSGSYSVLVANVFGTAVSSNAVLAVDRIPVAQCASVVVAAGPDCTATASVDQGSFDPDAEALTLSQTPPGPYPLGTNLVTLTVIDSHGASNSCTALVVVLDQTPPTLLCPADLVVTNAHDAWTSVVTYAASATDNCSGVGQPVCDSPSGTAFGLGTHTVNCSVADAAGNVAHGSFKVTVLSGNVPPVPVIQIQPLAHFPGHTNLLVIAPDNQQAKIVLDGSRSYDADDASFRSLWCGGTNLLGTNLVSTCVLNVGTNAITLWLDDTFPLGTNSASVAVEVITPAQGVTIVAGLLQRSGWYSQPGLATSLNAAKAAFNRRNFKAGLNELLAFQKQVRAQVGFRDPVLAHLLLQAAQQIIDALNSATTAGRAPVKMLSLTHQQGKLHLKFAGPAGKAHLVQASTNLVDWQTIGTATDRGDGSFEFEDAKAAGVPARFYRIIAP